MIGIGLVEADAREAVLVAAAGLVVLGGSTTRALGGVIGGLPLVVALGGGTVLVVDGTISSRESVTLLGLGPALGLPSCRVVEGRVDGSV